MKRNGTVARSQRNDPLVKLASWHSIGDGVAPAFVKGAPRLNEFRLVGIQVRLFINWNENAIRMLSEQLIKNTMNEWWDAPRGIFISRRRAPPSVLNSFPEVHYIMHYSMNL